jgi:hypothetical protein
MNRINRFAPLYTPPEATDYEEFEDIAPYNKLQDGKWSSLRLNRHPLYWKIYNRFNGDYRGKLLWKELNAMKEKIEKLQKSLSEYQNEVSSRREELIDLIRGQEKLCREDTRVSTLETVLSSAITATTTDNQQTPLAGFVYQVPEAMLMMESIISFIPIETCGQKLQKHLDICAVLNANYKCTKNYVSHDCRFNENGRCSHYYEIERANEELEDFEYYEHEDMSKIWGLQADYERALAVKENRLDEYLQDDEF